MPSKLMQASLERTLHTHANARTYGEAHTCTNLKIHLVELGLQISKASANPSHKLEFWKHMAIQTSKDYRNSGAREYACTHTHTRNALSFATDTSQTLLFTDPAVVLGVTNGIRARWMINVPCMHLK